MRKTRRKLLHLSFLILIILLCFTLGELSLRLIDHIQTKELTFEGGNLHIKTNNERLPYILNPNSSLERNNITYYINKEGYRDQVYSLEKSLDSYRILVIGDSITFGSLVEEEDRYTEILEGILNTYNPQTNYEVINFGVSGYSTTNEIELLETKGLDYNPDIIILGYALNDVVARESEIGEKSFTNCKINALNLPISCKIKEILSSSILLQKIRNVIKNDETQKDIYIEYHNDEEHWNYLVDQFDILKNISEERDIPILIIIFPILSNLDNYQWSTTHEQLEELFTSQNFMTIDMYDQFKDYNSSELKAIEGDPWHPNQLGHELTGEEIFIKLINEKEI